MSKMSIRNPANKKSQFLHKRIETLEKYNRSNQDTCLMHKPAVNVGEWVESGDLLADSSASMNGELAIGKNIVVAYMPWEGYNYEDAILINERLVYDDVYTSIHIERYEIETKEGQLGREQITREIPDIAPEAISHLDSTGIAKIGSWIAEGDILVGKVIPINKKSQTPYQRLLFKLLDKTLNSVRDSSLRAPKGIKANVINIQILEGIKKSEFEKEKKAKNPKKGIINNDISVLNTTHSKKTVNNNINQSKQNLLNLKTNRFQSLLNNSRKMNSIYKKPIIKDVIQLEKVYSICNNFNKSSTLELNTNLQHHWTQVSNTLNELESTIKGKAVFCKYFNLDISKKYSIDTNIKKRMCSQTSPLNFYLKKSEPTFINSMYSGLKIETTSMVTDTFETPRNINLTTIVKKKSKMHLKKNLKKPFSTYSTTYGEKIIPTVVHIYLAEKRKIQVGDKMAGRHGNKGIISNILPREDMPFLPDGSPIDIVLNPLGVPSRMNVGQIYECLLGLAGKYLGEHYKIFPFDEIYGAEASRSFVFAKLFEARKKTGIEWLFDPNSPGKMRIFDGRTCECFDQPITVGIAYMLKLVHMVDDKIHARSTGPYSLVTQQPLRGRAKQGGQRLGEMEVWAIEGYGAAFVLLEMLTIKSDDMTGRLTLWSNLILNKDISIGTPESFKVLVCELQALCLDIGLFHFDSKSRKSMNSKIYKPLLLEEISHLMLLP